jgi:hypothetical protein
MANNSFVLRLEVDQLEYNFEPYSSKGFIPEPTSQQIQNFRQSLAELIGETSNNAPNTDDPVGLVKRVADYLGQDTTEITAKILHIAADVCSNQPSYDDLEAIPYRAQQAFLGWLTGVFLIPETRTPATNG